MNKSSNARHPQPKKLSKRHKSTKKKTKNQNSYFLSRFIPKNRKGVFKLVLALVIFVAIVGAVPFPHTFAKSTVVDFATENQKNAGLELGDSKVLQEGRHGTKVVNIEAYQSIWGRLLGLEPIQQKEVSEKIVEKPVSKIVANGSKKYQYMLCTDGRYRYFTDEQFKDPNIGFTSKSEDYCEKNKQGKMIGLSDTGPDNGSTTSTSGRSPTVTTRGGCTYTSIPYKTVYQDVSWLDKGELRVSKGSDGTKSSCGWSTDPIDEVVSRGTSESSASSSSGSSSNQDSAAYTRCQSAYSSAMSQIQASISQGMSGQDALKRQVESEFARCKRAAGY